MGRAIVGVLVGYVAMFAAIFLAFSGLYLILGQERSFRPGSYEPSILWTAVSFALGIGAAILGGFVCARIARTTTPPNVLAGLVFGIGILSAIPVVMAASTPAEARTGDVGNLDAMMKAKQPAWVAVANPFVGLAGVLLGARLRRPQRAA
jgi:xanthosine utilization system XapX-like protein